MISHHQLRKILPQRYPMLLLDKVISLGGQKGNEIVAIKNITCTEPCFSQLDETVSLSAFAYPCSLLIESFSQSVGVMLCSAWKEKMLSSSNIIVFGSMAGLVFHRDVFPGDTIEHRAVVNVITDDSAVIGGSSYVDKQLVFSAERITAVLKSNPGHFSAGEVEVHRFRSE